MTTIVVVIAALFLVAIFGVQVARFVEAKRCVEATMPNDEASTAGDAPPQPADPHALRSWRRVGYDLEITLESGRVFRGWVFWKSFPDGREISTLSKVEGALSTYKQQIEWELPAVMNLEAKS